MTEAFTNFCNDKGLKFQQVDEVAYRLGYGGRNACFDSFVVIDEDEGEILMETFLPIKVTPERCVVATEMVTRLNSKFRNGFLELNLKHGYLIYKTNLLLGTSELQSDMIKHLIFSNWLSADYSFPAINAVLFGNIPPEKAADELGNSRGSNKKHPKEESVVPKTVDMRQILRGRFGGFTNN